MATREKLFCDHISADGEPCDKNYSTNRPENLKRHIDEYHLGIKQKCEKCGKEMTISSLIRHKKNGTCLLANTSCDKSNDKEIHHSISELSDPNTPNTTELSTHQPDLISVEDHILITKIQMLRFDDGTTQVNPSKSQHIIGESVITVAITYSGKVDIESIHESNAHNELVENDVFLSSNSNEGKMSMEYYCVQIILCKNL